MRTQRYDQLAQHKADHERLLDELREMMDQLPRESLAAERAQALTVAVEAWFATHFRTHDARLHRQLSSRHA
jgi:hemerythrin